MKTYIWIIAMMLPFAQAETSITPIENGLTLAVIETDRVMHTIAVLKDENDVIEGINLSQMTGYYGDAVFVYQKLGYEKIKSLIQTADDQFKAVSHYDSLLSPAGRKNHHIAFGLNYRHHASEVELEARPFAFLKTLQPTRDEAISYAPGRLLDFEVELCARPLETISNMDSEVEFGYFLCGDFTDRAALLRNMNLTNPQSGKGFRLAKSVDGYYPTGPYMVIPANPKEFIGAVELQLIHNNKIAQQARGEEMIWTLNEGINHIWSLDKDNMPTYSDRVSWLQDGEITSEMTLLTGTPDGVLFRPPSFLYKAIRGTWYFLTFKFVYSDQSVIDYVVECYVNDLLKGDEFLSRGNQVVLYGTGLGHIVIDII